MEGDQPPRRRAPGSPIAQSWRHARRAGKQRTRKRLGKTPCSARALRPSTDWALVHPLPWPARRSPGGNRPPTFGTLTGLTGFSSIRVQRS